MDDRMLGRRVFLYSSIALESQEGKQFLNVAKDNGDFGLHIRKLQKYIQELESLHKPTD